VEAYLIHIENGRLDQKRYVKFDKCGNCILWKIEAEWMYTEEKEVQQVE
jgi:hypothetical protein